MQTLLQDLRVGMRMLRRSPGFSILAILCLTLGIGTNAAVLSWIEGILILAVATAKIVSGILYGVGALDPVAFTVAPAVLTVAALIATWLPARRATRVNPAQALRAE